MQSRSLHGAVAVQIDAPVQVPNKASGQGIGSVLMQQGRPIAYFKAGVIPTRPLRQLSPENPMIHNRDVYAVAVASFAVDFGW
jgi:hypothetical protein